MTIIKSRSDYRFIYFLIIEGSFSKLSIEKDTNIIIIISLFIYWALLTAPSGEKEGAAMVNPYLMISTLLMASSIHDIISQNILKHQNKSNYGTIILPYFIIGTIIYTFVGFGSLGN